MLEAVPISSLSDLFFLGVFDKVMSSGIRYRNYFQDQRDKWFEDFDPFRE